MCAASGSSGAGWRQDLMLQIGKGASVLVMFPLQQSLPISQDESHTRCVDGLPYRLPQLGIAGDAELE
jgi:hypothetical protein